VIREHEQVMAPDALERAIERASQKDSTSDASRGEKRQVERPASVLAREQEAIPVGEMEDERSAPRPRKSRRAFPSRARPPKRAHRA